MTDADGETTAYRQAFGRKLRVERLRRGLSQEAFGALLGLDRTFYGAIERGEAGCNITRLPRMARGLGVEPAELLP